MVHQHVLVIISAKKKFQSSHLREDKDFSAHLFAKKLVIEKTKRWAT